MAAAAVVVLVAGRNGEVVPETASGLADKIEGVRRSSCRSSIVEIA